jgi:hypothetical protein
VFQDDKFDKDFNDAKKFLLIVGGVAAAIIYAIIKVVNHYF